MRSLLVVSGMLFMASVYASLRPTDDGAPAAAQRRGCRPIVEPKQLLGVDALFDSSALVANLPAADSLGPTEDALTVVTGVKPRAYINDPSSTHFGVTAVEKVLSALRPGSKSVTPAFRLRVVFDKPLRLTIERPELCDPIVVGDPVARASYTTVQPSRGPGRSMPEPRPRSVTPHITIGENGEVLDVNLGSGTGIDELDRSMKRSLESQKWRPALLDGHPIVVVFAAGKVEIVR